MAVLKGDALKVYLYIMGFGQKDLHSYYILYKLMTPIQPIVLRYLKGLEANGLGHRWLWSFEQSEELKREDSQTPLAQRKLLLYKPNVPLKGP